MAEHDSAYKLLFSHREMVADLIRGFVHEDWVAQLDYATLERVSEGGVSLDLRARADDLIWRVRWGERWLYVYLLLEFQSRVDRLMAVRLLPYVGLLYQDLAAAGELPAGAHLPPVLPIVLYNSEAPWSAKTSLAELMAPDLPAQLLHWQPQIRYLLLDERRYAEAELVRLHNVAAALFRLENSRSPEDIERVLASLAEWLGAPEQAALRRAFVVWLERVLLPARIPGADIPHITELHSSTAANPTPCASPVAARHGPRQLRTLDLHEVLTAERPALQPGQHHEDSVMNELESLFDKTVAEVERLLSSKAVVGEPIQIEGYTLVPLVSIGFALGAGSGTGKMDMRAKGEGEGGAVGAGGGIKPTAVIVVGPEGVSLQPLKGGAASLIEKIAQTLAKTKGEPDASTSAE